jgi:predicted Rossmann-fold nucleotide-binding protein
LAQTLAKGLVENRFMIISGAGGGIMEATHCGAGAENSFRLNIKLPHEQQANSYIRDTSHLMEFKCFFTRKLVFTKESHATVLLPGGFRTIDEGF